MIDPAIKEAMEAERIFMSDPDTYLRYVNRQIAIMDFDTNMKYAREEGLSEGEAKGRAEGENRLARLMTLLYEKWEGEEARRAVTERETRHRLYEKYHIE